MSLGKSRKGFKKHFNGSFGSTTKDSQIEFGEYGLVALSSGQVREKTLSAVQFYLRKRVKDKGRFYFKIVPDYSCTKKSLKMGMGKGAGKFDHLASFVRSGKVMVELSGFSRDVCERMLKVVSSKLPVKSVFVKRR